MNATTSSFASETALAAEVDAICSSTAFRHSRQQQRFLRHLLERSGDGDLPSLREMSLAIDLFRRPAGRFDPKKDPIVRVEARRLRERLRRYYALEGERATIEIVVPIGSYVPLVRPRVIPSPPAVAMPADAKLLEDRAWYLMRMRTIEGYRKALKIFSRAANEFPDLASAYRGIAWARGCIAASLGVPPEAGEQREPMRVAIETAAALDPDHPEIYALKGGWAMRFGHELDYAERLYLEGLNRNPSSNTRTSYAWFCTMTGRFEEAQRVFETAHAADPFAFWHRVSLGKLAYFRRDYVTAEKILSDALDIEPEHTSVRFVLAGVLMRTGRGSEALEQFDWCESALQGMTGTQLYRIIALGNAGEQRAAKDAMRDFERDSAGRYTSPAYRAATYAALGEIDVALEWLARGVEERDYWMLDIGVDPAFDRLRPRAEFAAILRSLGLPA